MSIRDTTPPRDVKFVPETPNSTHTSEPLQEHQHTSKKPRNYKYWSDEEVRKILHWLTLPENEGKLARNKAQACREVAKKLFDGDEYMAISVRSKLMSLEKSFKEAEQLRSQLNGKEDAHVYDKVKEISKFYKECKHLFGTGGTGEQTGDRGGSRNSSHDSLGYLPPISTSPIIPANSIPTPSSSVPYSPNLVNYNHRLNHHPHPHQHPHQYQQYQQQSPNQVQTTAVLPRPEGDSSQETITDDRLRKLTIPPHLIRRGSWTLPRVSTVDLAPVAHNDDQVLFIEQKKRHEEPNANVRIARYAAKQASYAAKQAEFEAVKSKHEQYKMEYAIELAKIELDRDALSIRKLELELELLKSKAQA
ncbi:hypothetical protein A0J61_06051 [Choanephora cucurbitarum]|uniref:Uncharacterized protein n=1 Tax=Choanephora cucurbitarum TaxID=101091 RepID=A0A1C7N9T9_9FUNG|nr:hypothetical protein A0J61_06051 [Choanephora cucurbitarum]